MKNEATIFFGISYQPSAVSPQQVESRCLYLKLMAEGWWAKSRNEATM